jgi:hypothetical protein
MIFITIGSLAGVFAGLTFAFASLLSSPVRQALAKLMDVRDELFLTCASISAWLIGVLANRSEDARSRRKLTCWEASGRL